MPKFLTKGNYTVDGMRGLQRDKALRSGKSISEESGALGGKLDAIYYALGDDDVFVVVDLPSHIQVATLCAAVGASGLANTRTVPLLTVAELDRALSRETLYKTARGLTCFADRVC